MVKKVGWKGTHKAHGALYSRYANTEKRNGPIEYVDKNNGKIYRLVGGRKIFTGRREIKYQNLYGNDRIAKIIQKRKKR